MTDLKRFEELLTFEREYKANLEINLVNKLKLEQSLTEIASLKEKLAELTVKGVLKSNLPHIHHVTSTTSLENFTISKESLASVIKDNLSAHSSGSHIDKTEYFRVGYAVANDLSNLPVKNWLTANEKSIDEIHYLNFSDIENEVKQSISLKFEKDTIDKIAAYDKLLVNLNDLRKSNTALALEADTLKKEVVNHLKEISDIKIKFDEDLATAKQSIKDELFKTIHDEALASVSEKVHSITSDKLSAEENLNELSIQHNELKSKYHSASYIVSDIKAVVSKFNNFYLNRWSFRIFKKLGIRNHVSNLIIDLQDIINKFKNEDQTT